MARLKLINTRIPFKYKGLDAIVPLNTQKTFTATATGGIPPYTYAWTFGDNTTASGQQVQHSYTTAGNYVIGVTVTDAAGNMATGATNVTVSQARTATATYIEPNGTQTTNGQYAVGDQIQFAVTVPAGGGLPSTVAAVVNGAEQPSQIWPVSSGNTYIFTSPADSNQGDTNLPVSAIVTWPDGTIAQTNTCTLTVIGNSFVSYQVWDKSTGATATVGPAGNGGATINVNVGDSMVSKAAPGTSVPAGSTVQVYWNNAVAATTVANSQGYWEVDGTISQSQAHSANQAWIVVTTPGGAQIQSDIITIVVA